MEIEKEIKPKNIDIVLASIKKGNCTRNELLNALDINKTTMHTALSRLCSLGLINKDCSSRNTKYTLVGGK